MLIGEPTGSSRRLKVCVTKPFASLYLLLDFSDPLFAQMPMCSEENVDRIDKEIVPIDVEIGGAALLALSR